jgi:ectoine hydroxylase-related dioxygenase (phytanoyl-CoA dioxygenase family)
MQLFGQIMLNDSLLKFMEILHKEEVSGLTSQYLFKRPNTKYGKQSWVPHQDNAYPKAPHGHYTIVHLALDASNQNNGGLVFWKGSHVEPILPYIYKKSWMEESDPDGIARPGWEIKNIPNQYQKINIELNPGDLCFMHGHLIHGSQSNNSSDLSREQYSMGYCVSGSPFLEGVTSKKRVFTKSELVQVPIKPEHYEISGQ